MKKLLSLFLVLALAFSLCVGVLAEEPADERRQRPPANWRDR